MTSRINRLRTSLASSDIDALYVTHLVNIRYLSGFTGSSGLLLVTPETARLYVDSRYHVQAEQQTSGVEVCRCQSRLTAEAWDDIKTLAPERIGFEATHITVAAHEDLAKGIPGSTLVPVRNLIEELRLVKDEDEIAITRRACAMADELFEWLLGFIKPGMREQDVDVELEYQMRKRGAQGPAFPSIIVSGVNSSKPHGTPSSKVIETGDFITMDFGVRLDGYNSDITRTVAVGKADDKQREVYEVVRKAQAAAVEALRPGIGHLEADAVARDIITEAGYGPKFGHALGHSLGLDVHDGYRLSNVTDPEGKVQQGEIWTVEPGIYIEDWGGVRIEDDVLVTADGSERLTKSTRELIII